MIIHFIRPHWLWLLLPAIIYLIWLIYFFKQRNPWKNVCDPHLLRVLVQFNATNSQRFFYFLLFLFYFFSIFALAGPSWKIIQLPVYSSMNSMMLVLDLSDNMNKDDLKPNRLLRAKYKISDLIQANQHLQMGLVVFTQEAFVASPLSQDVNTLHTMIDELSPDIMPVSGSDSGQGLIEGYKLLKQAGDGHGNLLLITASLPTVSSWNAAKMIAKDGAHLNVLGMINKNTTNQKIIDDLKELAKTGGGTFYLFTADNSDIRNILSSLDNKKIIKMQNNNTYQWQDTGPWFCLLLIPIALFVFRKYAS